MKKKELKRELERVRRERDMYHELLLHAIRRQDYCTYPGTPETLPINDPFFPKIWCSNGSVS